MQSHAIQLAANYTNKTFYKINNACVFSPVCVCIHISLSFVVLKVKNVNKHIINGSN